MKIERLIKLLNARAVNVPDGFDREIVGGYCGDLLSFVMSRAPTDCAWFTIMTNVNVAAVATLSGAACVVICEGSSADGLLIDKAVSQGIAVIETDLTVFDAVKAFLQK